MSTSQQQSSNPNENRDTRRESTGSATSASTVIATGCNKLCEAITKEYQAMLKKQKELDAAAARVSWRKR